MKFKECWDYAKEHRLSDILNYYNQNMYVYNYKTKIYELITSDNTEFLTANDLRSLLQIIEANIHSLFNWDMIIEYIGLHEASMDIYYVIKHNLINIINDIRNIWRIQNLSEGKNYATSKYMPIENDEANMDNLLNNNINTSFSNFVNMAQQNEIALNSLKSIDNLYAELQQLINPYGNL